MENECPGRAVLATDSVLVVAEWSKGKGASSHFKHKIKLRNSEYGTIIKKGKGGVQFSVERHHPLKRSSNLQRDIGRAELAKRIDDTNLDGKYAGTTVLKMNPAAAVDAPRMGMPVLCSKK